MVSTRLSSRVQQIMRGGNPPASRTWLPQAVDARRPDRSMGPSPARRAGRGRRCQQAPHSSSPAIMCQHVPAPDGWTKTFTDPRLRAAAVDRLTFSGSIIETGTDSYRLAGARARAEQPAKAG